MTRFPYVAAVARARSGRAARISLPGANALSTVGADDLTTRCGGPLQGDLRAALPTALLGRALPRPGAVVDLRGRRPFAAHGFAGTVESTITVRVGRRERPQIPRSRRARERVRAITARYAIERVEGGTTTTLTGSADPAACGRLDACGVTGTVTSTFGQAREGRLTLIASVEGRRPWRDLRAALGLTRGGRRREVVVTGYGGWDGGPGSATTASLAYPGGGPPCSDSVPLPAGFLFLLPTKRTGTIAASLSQPDALRTRCAGPRQDDLSPHDDALAAGEIPIRALTGRRPVLRFMHDLPLTTDGYAGSTRIDFTVHLRRLRITRRTIVG
jgi:hypothetical protein